MQMPEPVPLLFPVDLQQAAAAGGAVSTPIFIGDPRRAARTGEHSTSLGVCQKTVQTSDVLHYELFRQGDEILP